MAAATSAFGCHRARAGQGAPDAIATSVATTEGGSPPSAEDEYWAHTKQVFNVPVGRSPVLGPPGALVTIAYFSEFQCASCGGMASLRALRAKYGAKIRLVWKNKPVSLQPAAEPAAEAALEVRSQRGDPAFWAVHDRFVDRQSDLVNREKPDVDLIVKIASEVGADAGKVRKAILERTHEKEIEADLDMAEDFEVESVPHFFVNGRRLEGVQPEAKLARMIDEEILHAQVLLASGTPPEAIYQTIVAHAAGPWRPKSKPVPALPPNDPALGDPNAKVTIHVWSDYQCALCVAVERAIADLRKEHGREVRFVWHDLPLPRHREARLFAQAAREAYAQKGAPGFWAMHDKISSDRDVPSMPDLEGFARDLDLDLVKWKAALDGKAHASEIEADEKAAGDTAIAETPAFLVVTKGAARGIFVGNIEYASKLGRAVEKALDGD